MLIKDDKFIMKEIKLEEKENPKNWLQIAGGQASEGSQNQGRPQKQIQQQEQVVSSSGVPKISEQDVENSTQQQNAVQQEPEQQDSFQSKQPQQSDNDAQQQQQQSSGQHGANFGIPKGFKLSFGDFMLGAVFCTILGGPLGLSLYCAACGAGYVSKTLHDGGWVGASSNTSNQSSDRYTPNPADSNGAVHTKNVQNKAMMPGNTPGHKTHSPDERKNVR